ncbi:MAG: membrane protein insertase YidC [Deltaproteobacteria bacterium]|nr:membrane protein insertase YidC [Kofleriaceae bacterium]
MEDQGKRILLFVVIAGVIFFAWQWLFPPEKPKPQPPAVAGETSGVPSSVTSPVGRPKDGAPAPAEVPVTEDTIVLESNAVKLTFSNVGGVVKEWELLHDPVKGRVMRELLVRGEQPGKSLGAVNFSNSTHVLPVAAEWKGEKLSDTKVRYRYTGSGLDVTKEYELFPEAYVLKLTVEFGLAPGATGTASQRLAVSVFGGAPGDPAARVRVPTGSQCHINGEVSSPRAGELARTPRERQGTIRYAGLAHRYDLVAMSPRDGKSESLACNAYKLEGVKDGVQVDLVYPESTLKPGDAVQREVTIYAGPRYLEKLEGADTIAGYETGFRDVLDFGWFSFIAKPMLWLLTWLYDFVGNWGIAIILLTVIVKLATLYWTTKSMRSMRAMAALKPEIEALQKKYPDDKAKQQQAQMDLFKQHGVSPLAGCLPMLLQMPIWFALYKMLSVAGELHGAVFIPGWLEDLTARDPYFIVPIALTGLMFLQSKVQPATGDSMQQKMLMYGLPLMFGVMGLYFPSGLGVYMVTNSFLSIGHTLYMKRSDGKTPPKATAKAETKTAAKAEAKTEAKLEKKSDAKADASDDEDVEDEESGDEVAEEPTPARGQAAAKNTSAAQAQRRGKRRGKRR